MVIKTKDIKVNYGNKEYNKKSVTNIVGAYAIAYRKNSAPMYFFADFSIYDKSKKNDAWANYPTAMILKVAESRVKKRLFIADPGILTESEYDWDRASEPEIITSNDRRELVAKAKRLKSEKVKTKIAKPTIKVTNATDE